jgi:hypothetical protein
MKLATALLVLGICAGCAVSPPDNSADFKPGIGVVEAVKPARVAVSQTKDGAIAGSEAAGGRYGTAVERIFRPRWAEGYQLTLRMNDGTTQQVTQDNAAFQVGDRVQVMSDGRIVKTSVAPSPAPAAGAAGAASAGTTVRPGVGTVESASVVSLGSSPSVGGTAASATMAYRVQMADGTSVSIVQAGERFAVGERVQVTRDGRLSRR